MAEISNYTPLNIKKFAKKPISQNPENKFWKKYEKVFDNQYQDSIQQVNSDKNKKGLIGFVYRNTLEIYDSKNQETKFNLNKLFKSNLKSVTIREDGELIAVGEESGRVQIIDYKKKNPLRKHDNHKKPVGCIKFLGKQQLVSGSDDLNINLFDIVTDQVTVSYNQIHNDYIRSLQILNNNVIISGSYDGTVSLLDLNNNNNNNNNMKFKHGFAVEDIAVFSNGFSFVSVGEKWAKLWDIRNNSEPILSSQTNQKNISAVKIILDNQRIALSSYDNHLKILNAQDFQVTNQFKFTQPIMSFDFIQDSSQFAIGLIDGNFQVFKKNMQASDQDEQQPDIFKDFFQNEESVVKNYKYFYRGMFDQPESFTFIQGEERKKKLKAYDKFIKKFQFKNALMSCLHTKQNDLVVSVIEELIQRNSLKISLKGMDQQELDMVIDFIVLKLQDQRFNQICLEIVQYLFELYWNQLDLFKDSFKKLIKAMEEEIKEQEELLELKGMMDMIVTNSFLN